MRISAIVCTHNRAPLLERAIESLLAQSLSPDEYEIVVVDNASKDATRTVVERFEARDARVCYCFEPQLGISRARNRGVAAARSGIVAFMDDDCEAQPGWLEALAQAFEREQTRPMAAGGRIQGNWTARRPGWLPDDALYLLSLLDLGPEARACHLPEDGLPGCNLAFEREFLLAAGGFDERLGRRGRRLLGNEESALLFRIEAAEGLIQYEPGAVVRHLVPAERLRLSWFVRRMFGQGQSDVVLSRLRSAYRPVGDAHGAPASRWSRLRYLAALLAGVRTSRDGFRCLLEVAYHAGKAAALISGTRETPTAETRGDKQPAPGAGWSDLRVAIRDAAIRLKRAARRGQEYRRSQGWRRFLGRLARPDAWTARLRDEPLRPGWLDRRPGAALARLRERPFGVNVAGNVTALTGLGEGARQTAVALEAAGIAVALNNDSPADQRPGPYAEQLALSATNPYRFNLVFVSADRAEAFAWERGRRYFEGRYNIALWPWENESFREDWQDNFLYYDEIWAPSRFAVEALARLSPVPVLRIPHAVAAREASERPRSRLLAGIAPDAFVFLFVFDFRSMFERKNPLAAIAAFRKAFCPEDDAWLVIKSSAGAGQRELALLRQAASEAGRVRVVDESVSREEIDDLMRDCDCYVSLHRSEGFGLTLAEAMAFGKPVIATAYGGNLDFMTAANSYLVDYELRAIERDVRPYRKGWLWAEPDLTQAASIMRRVFESRDEALALGARARADVERLLAPRVVGELMRARLEAVGRGGSEDTAD